jgi:hypothetical protein
LFFALGFAKGQHVLTVDFFDMLLVDGNESVKLFLDMVGF